MIPTDITPLIIIGMAAGAIAGILFLVLLVGKEVPVGRKEIPIILILTALIGGEVVHIKETLSYAPTREAEFYDLYPLDWHKEGAILAQLGTRFLYDIKPGTGVSEVQEAQSYSDPRIYRTPGEASLTIYFYRCGPKPAPWSDCDEKLPELVFTVSPEAIFNLEPGS